MSRRHAAAVLTLLLPLGLALAAPALADTAADASSTAVILAPSDPSDCTLTVTQRVWPPLLLAGEDLDVAVRVEPFCPVVESYLNVVLVLPASSEVPAGDRRALRDQAQRLVDRILDRGPGCCGEVTQARVGIVTYDQVAREACQPTDDAEALRRCVDGVTRDRPGHDVGRGLQSGDRMLRRARADHPDAVEVLILVAGTENLADCARFGRTASSLKSRQVLVIGACAGDACDHACLRGLASSARYAYSRLDQAIRVFEPISCECLNIGLRLLALSQALPPGLRYVEGSASPPIDDAAPEAALGWTRSFVPKQGLTLSYRARPTGLGFQTFALTSTITFRDVRNRPGAAASEARFGVAVFDPRAMAP
ncbi:MAG: VWA domain-containing protein [Chloroflexi bacterium]|nr:VWA domain-containing protein [Chloroflexota bacterium]